MSYYISPAAATEKETQGRLQLAPAGVSDMGT